MCNFRMFTYLISSDTWIMYPPSSAALKASMNLQNKDTITSSCSAKIHDKHFQAIKNAATYISSIVLTTSCKYALWNRVIRTWNIS